jgi:hypothetical protein
LTAAARARFFQGFLDQVDPDRALGEEERMRRAEHALRSHMTLLALKSSKARAARKAAENTTTNIEHVVGGGAA